MRAVPSLGTLRRCSKKPDAAPKTIRVHAGAAIEWLKAHGCADPCLEYWFNYAGGLPGKACSEVHGGHDSRPAAHGHPRNEESVSHRVGVDDLNAWKKELPRFVVQASRKDLPATF